MFFKKKNLVCCCGLGYDSGCRGCSSCIWWSSGSYLYLYSFSVRTRVLLSRLLAGRATNRNMYRQINKSSLEGVFIFLMIVYYCSLFPTSLCGVLVFFVHSRPHPSARPPRHPLTAHTPLFHTALSHHFVTHLSLTQLCHTPVFHTTLSHTCLSHTHTPLSHTSLSHAFRTQLCHTLSYAHNFVTHNFKFTG